MRSFYPTSILTAVLAGLALAACGGSTPPPATPAAEVADAADATDHEAAQPEQASAESAPAAEPEPEPEPELEVIALPQPPFKRFVADEITAGAEKPPRVRLVQVSVKRNQITDDERWFAEHNLSLPATRAGPNDPETPQLMGLPLDMYISEGDLDLVLFSRYGDPRALLIGLDGSEAETPEFIFDFTAWARPPVAKPGDEAFVDMEIPWALARGERLFVSHGHRTYASSSGGKNAYLVALRIPDGEVLWSSQSLVSNARNFALVTVDGREVIVTGYGFTNEPDFLFVLDPETGAVLAKKKLRKGPTYIIPKDGQIYVRTYDRDYVFRLESR